LDSDSEVNLPSQIYESVRIDSDVCHLLYLSIDDTWWSDSGQGNARDKEMMLLKRKLAAASIFMLFASSGLPILRSIAHEKLSVCNGSVAVTLN